MKYFNLIFLISVLVLSACGNTIVENNDVLDEKIDDLDSYEQSDNLEDIKQSNNENTNQKSVNEIKSKVDDNKPIASFEVTSFEVDKNINMNNYIENDEFTYEDYFVNGKLNGRFIVNQEDLDDFDLQLRFYNSKVNEDVDLTNTNEFEAKVTNKFVNLNKPLLYQDSSKNKFPKGSVNEIEINFIDIPDWRNDLHYDYSLKEWRKGNYDVDKAEVNIFHKGEKIVSVPVELPPQYKKDTKLDIVWIDGSYSEYNTEFHAISFNITNKENMNLDNLKFKIDIKKYYTGLYQKGEEDYRSYEKSINSFAENGAFRYKLGDELFISKGSKSSVKYNKVYVDLFDGNDLIDRRIVPVKLGEDVFIGLSKEDLKQYENDYGYKLFIEDLYGNDEDSYIVVNLRRDKLDFPDKENIDIENPVLDLFCGSTKVYELQDELYKGYDENLKIRFNWGRCEHVHVHLRDGNSQKVLGATSLI